MIENDKTKIWIKRTRGSIYGVVTMQRVEPDGRIVKVFDRLPMASGQTGYTSGGAQDWVTGRGATPIGSWWLSTRREALQMTPVGTPFYVLSSEPGGRRMLGPGGKFREDAGIHLENDKAGTAGCTALQKRSEAEKRKALDFFEELDRLYAAGVKYLRTEVFF